MDSIRKIIREVLSEGFESETRTRYVVKTESYIYADSDEEAIDKSRMAAELIDSRIEELERTSVLSIHKPNTSSLGSTEINLNERL